MRVKTQSIFWVLAALLLLSGCLWLWWDQPSDENTESTVQALISEDLQNEIERITVEKDDNFYTISKKEEAYTVTGIDTPNVSQGLAENIFYRIVHLKSMALAQGIQEEDAGLTEPFLRLTLKRRESTDIEIVIGKKSTLLDGYFAKISGNKQIYIIESELPDEIYGTAEAYRTMNFVDFIYESDYEYLDYLEISGQNIISVAFRRTQDGFEMDKPVWQLCDQSAVKNAFLHAAVHLNADEYVGDKEVPEMGFENPDYLISMKYRGENIKILIGGKTGDKRYIKKDGNDAVYLIQQSHLKFLDTDYRSAIGESLYPRSVKVISGVTVSIEGKRIELTEVTAVGKGYVAKADGKIIESNVFLPFYNSIRNLELLKNISTPGNEEIKLKVFLIDGRSDDIVLGNLNEREYSVSINGVCTFSASKASVDNLKIKIDKLKDYLDM